MKKTFLPKTESQQKIFDAQPNRSYAEDAAPIIRHKAPAGFRGAPAENGPSGRIQNGSSIEIPQQQPNQLLSSAASSSAGNNSKIAAGPLSGNEAVNKVGHGAPIYLNEDGEDNDSDAQGGPSDTDEDDDEERLDCVHDIHNDGEEADVEEGEDEDEIDLVSGSEHQVVNMLHEETLIEEQRPLVNDSSMDGDIEDADGNDTERERRFPKRPSLFNKLSGAEQQSSVDSETHQYKKKSTLSGGSKQFPLNQMRRRQSGSMGQGFNQIQINGSVERPSNLTGSFQEGDKQVLAQGRGLHNHNAGGTKGLFSGSHKIKLNSSTVNHNQSGGPPGFSRLNSDQNVVIGSQGVGGPEAAMRNSHYQQENSAYTWSQGMAPGQQHPTNPPRSRQETDFRRKTLQNFNTRSNKALGSTGANQRTAQPDKMILPLRGENLEHSPYQKDRQQQFSMNQPYQASSHVNHYSNKFSKSSTRRSSNNLNLQQMSFQGGSSTSGQGNTNGSIQNSKRVRESHSQSQSPSMLGLGHGHSNNQANHANMAYKNSNTGSNSQAIRQFMKGNLKNQQTSQTNSGYPAPTNSYISQASAGPMQHKTNLNRLAFTANNFYDSRNMLSGVQQYGMRPSADGQPHGQIANSGTGAQGGQQTMSRQSRSRQKIIKTNTYGAMQQNPTHSPGQIQHQNSFGSGVQPPSNGPSIQQSPYDNALPMVEDFYGQQQNMARNTFYVSDDQRQKGNLFKDLNAGKMHQQQFIQRGAPSGNHYFAGAGSGNSNLNQGGNSNSRQAPRVIWNGPGGQQSGSNQQLMHQGGFTKPRALSRQADAHIKIEVHRDIKIRNYLQNKQTENMNLMFYDFNGSSFGTANNTAQNFYKPSEQIEPGQEPANQAQEVSGAMRMNFRAEGDRVPTRERGYRSANQNMRRRDLHKKNVQNLQGGAGNTGMSSVNETVAEHPGEHDMIPQGL